MPNERINHYVTLVSAETEDKIEITASEIVNPNLKDTSKNFKILSYEIIKWSDLSLDENKIILWVLSKNWENIDTNNKKQNDDFLSYFPEEDDEYEDENEYEENDEEDEDSIIEILDWDQSVDLKQREEIENIMTYIKNLFYNQFENTPELKDLLSKSDFKLWDYDSNHELLN